MSDAVSRLQHHFATEEQQYETSQFGMWVFLVTEILFFGGLFCAYLYYRLWYPEAFVHASLDPAIPLRPRGGAWGQVPDGRACAPPRSTPPPHP